MRNTVPLAIPLIRTTYEIITPESASNGEAEECGWWDEEGEEIEPLDEEDDIAHAAARWLCDRGGTEPSSWPTYHGGVWYSTPDPEQDYGTGEDTYYSYHLVGFLPWEEREIYALVTGRT